MLDCLTGGPRNASHAIYDAFDTAKQLQGGCKAAVTQGQISADPAIGAEPVSLQHRYAALDLAAAAACREYCRRGKMVREPHTIRNASVKDVAMKQYSQNKCEKLPHID